MTTTTTQWTFEQSLSTFNLPFHDLLYKAHSTHRQHFNHNAIQISTLLSIKTGRCPEDCAYCPQSAHYDTGLAKEPLIEVQTVVEAAQRAKEAGSTRFCMGAAWRGPHDRDLDKVCSMISEVKKLGLETCVTLGLLKPHQTEKLKAAGLDFYNHNIDTSPEYYEKNHHHSHLSRSTGHPRTSPQCRHQSLLWRHSRYGRIKPRSHSHVNSFSKFS